MSRTNPWKTSTTTTHLRRNNLNFPVSIREIELQVKILLKRKTSGPGSFSNESYQTLRNTNNSTLSVPENRKGEHTSKFIYEASIILILKPNKYLLRKENQRPMSFINMEAKILNKNMNKLNLAK